jgi:tetratricopeptide (TPR) repeat protein
MDTGQNCAPVMAASSTSASSFDWKTAAQALLMIVCGWWIFSPMLHGDWVTDDAAYITDNPLLRDPARLWKAWFAPGSFIEYYPLHETVQWLQWKWFGANPYGYHVTNVLLHILSSLLVWRLLAKLRLPLAWLGGFLFLVHPTMVESVSWISEFKNTLSLPPFLLAMCCYIDYVESNRRRDYYLTLALFLVAMLCKITMAAFPAVMLLYVWWKRSTIRWSDVVAVLPFAAISLFLAEMTIRAGQIYADATFQPNAFVAIGGPLSHLALSGTVLFFYLAKSIWPFDPLPVYPQWTVDPPAFWEFMAWPIVAVIAFSCWMNRQSWGRHVLLGLGFFLLIIAPFLGLNSISYMKAAWAYDHFLYIPVIGVIGLVVAGLGQAVAPVSANTRRVVYSVAAIVVGIMAFTSWNYAPVWVSEDSLNAFDLKRNPTSWYVHFNTGVSLAKRGRDDEAIGHYLEAIKSKPLYADAHYNLANSYNRTHQYLQAIDQYGKTLIIDPKYVMAEVAVGLTLVELHDLPNAGNEFKSIVARNPLCAPAWAAWGDVYLRQNRWADAAGCYQKAIALDPQNAVLHSNLGIAYLQAGQIDDGIVQLKQSLEINPDNFQLQFNIALAYMNTNQTSEAIDHFKEAARLDPNDPNSRQMLAKLGVEM